VTVNQVYPAAVVVEGEIKVRNVINMNAVIDHRFVDGGRCKTLQRDIEE
jgi:pyruvate/2-oxoglutarate dehydrogenase complex dihydrolipoamide acyltransferase (E2) component